MHIYSPLFELEGDSSVDRIKLIEYSKMSSCTPVKQAVSTPNTSTPGSSSSHPISASLSSPYLTPHSHLNPAIASPSLMEKSSSCYGSRGDVSDSVIEGTNLDDEKNRKLAKIKNKLKKIMERINLEQKRKEENVNTYLKASAISITSNFPQNAKFKAEFEKRNQKSTQQIDLLQKKLEENKKKVHEIEKMTPAQFNEHSLHQQYSHKESNLLRSKKNVLHGLKGVGVGIKEGISGGITGSLSTGIRAKEYVSQLLLAKNARSTSADNLDRINDRVPLEETDRQSTPGSNTLPARLEPSFKYTSEDDDDNLSSITGSGSHDVKLKSCTDESLDVTKNIELLTNQRLLQLNEIIDSVVKETEEIKSEFIDFKEHQQNEVTLQRRKIEDLSFSTTLLDEQYTIICELRKADLENFSQTIEGIEEKLFYQANERTQDFQDALESTQTRITKMEMQLQQQRVSLIEGFETTTDIRNILTKIVNVLISLITLIFVLVNSITNTFLPFVSTRSRVIITITMLVVFYTAYYCQDELYALLNPWLPSSHG